MRMVLLFGAMFVADQLVFYQTKDTKLGLLSKFMLCWAVNFVIASLEMLTR